MIKENTCTISAGFFMFIEASNPRKLNDTAVLQSKIFLPSGERCLQFYYHMYGEDMGAIHVLYSSDAGDKKIWEKQQDQGNQWHLAHVQLSSTKSPYRVRYLSKFYFGRHEGFVTLSYVMSPKGPLLGFGEVSVAWSYSESFIFRNLIFFSNESCPQINAGTIPNKCSIKE